MQTNKTLLLIVATAMITMGALTILYAGFKEYRRADYMVSPIVQEETVESLRDRCFNMAQTDQQLSEMLFGSMATESATATPSTLPSN